jgi:hypothetical protein
VEEREREGLGILETWTGVLISMNSVLVGLRERRLEDINLAMLEKRAPRLLAVELKASGSEGEKLCRVECRQHRGGDCECEKLILSELTGCGGAV